MATLRLVDVTRSALARTFFTPRTLPDALEQLGFVQADPIRSPARAQDLILRHRVVDYRVNQIERAYRHLDVEEDAFVNYGFMPRSHVGLMLPRELRKEWSAPQRERARAIVAFVKENGTVHPEQLERVLPARRVRNAWGGTSKDTTRLLEALHHLGHLRVVGRQKGVRLYGVARAAPAELDAEARALRLLSLAISLYAPVPERTVGQLVSLLRYGARNLWPQLKLAQRRLLRELPRAEIGGQTWLWPAGEAPRRHAEVDDRVRLLAPFDPLVWDRRRFEVLFGWPYRFEAYTPAARRRWGYYAMPLLFRDQVIGWANCAAGSFALEFGFVAGAMPKNRVFARELERETADFRRFLSADSKDSVADSEMHAPSGSHLRDAK